MTSAFEQCLQDSWDVRRFESLESTNSTAHEYVKSGDIGPCWITADTQTAGRGRQGRAWLSRPGNLYATALFRYDLSMSVASQISFCAGLAVHDAILHACRADIDLKLKWPNDVRSEGAKVSGILIESAAIPGSAGYAIACGIGVNIAHAPDVEQATTSVHELAGRCVETPGSFVLRLDAALRQRLRQWRQDGFAAISRDWLERAEGLGHTIRVRQGDQYLDGVFEGLDETGALLLRSASGGLAQISAGDVQLLN